MKIHELLVNLYLEILDPHDPWPTMTVKKDELKQVLIHIKNLEREFNEVRNSLYDSWDMEESLMKWCKIHNCKPTLLDLARIGREER